MKYEKIIPTSNYYYKIFTFETKSPDRLIPPHWHESGELLFCLSGSLEIIFANEICFLEKNDIIFINSNYIHSSRSPIPGKFLAIQFPLKYLDEITEEKYFNEFLYSVKPIIKDERLVGILSFIYNHFDQDDLVYHLLVKAKIFEFFSVLTESYKLPITNVKEIKSVKYFDKMKEINAYIATHAKQELLIEEVANHFNYNPSYFSRFYKKFMGITFTDYLNSIRLELAYKELRDTDLTILEISLSSGFSNVRTFYNVFHKNYGISPQKYRQLYFTKK
ncbi:AraC family transcriptional regulator [Vagococcus fluvialis]|uniref:AraC family transcriptional regulator n=1 Tax=Vagococcus fluvialis TaxID=2738 RepID=UPI003B5A36EA